MDGMRILVPVHLHGTLAANAQGVFQLPCGATLVEVSAAGSNANDATLQVGTSVDADGILTAVAIGDSSVPVVKNAADFDGALCDQVSGYHAATTRSSLGCWISMGRPARRPKTWIFSSRLWRDRGQRAEDRGQRTEV